MASETDSPTYLSIPITGQTVGEKITARAETLGIPFRGQFVWSRHVSGNADVTFEPCGCCGGTAPCRLTPCTACENGYYGPFALFISHLNSVPGEPWDGLGSLKIITTFVNWYVSLAAFNGSSSDFFATGPCVWESTLPVQLGSVVYLDPYNAHATLYYDSGWKLKIELVFYGVPSGIIVILAFDPVLCCNTRFISTVTIDTGPDAPNTATLVKFDAVTQEESDTDTLYAPIESCGCATVVDQNGCCSEPIPKLLQVNYITDPGCDLHDYRFDLIFDPAPKWANAFTDGTDNHWGVLECVGGNWQLTIYNDPSTPTGGILYQENATVTNCYPFFLRFPTISGWCTPDMYFEIMP